MLTIEEELLLTRMKGNDNFSEENQKLIDSNGNTVGTVWVSTTNRRG